MTPVLVGTPGDGRGFALAGIDRWECDSRESAESRIDALMKGDSEPLIIFSAVVYDLIAPLCAKWRREGRGPLFVVLPRCV